MKKASGAVAVGRKSGQQLSEGHVKFEMSVRCPSGSV